MTVYFTRRRLVWLSVASRPMTRYAEVFSVTMPARRNHLRIGMPCQSLMNTGTTVESRGLVLIFAACVWVALIVDNVPATTYISNILRFHVFLKMYTNAINNREATNGGQVPRVRAGHEVGRYMAKPCRYRIAFSWRLGTPWAWTAYSFLQCTTITIAGTDKWNNGAGK